MLEHGRRRKDRIRRGCRKKLRAALRYSLERKATDDFLLDLVDEEADASYLTDAVKPPAGYAIEDLGVYLATFRRLLHDRQYGAFGGATSISYLAVSAYARDFGIAGEDYDVFLCLISELDQEYLEYLERSRPSDKPEV